MLITFCIIIWICKVTKVLLLLLYTTVKRWVYQLNDVTTNLDSQNLYFLQYRFYNKFILTKDYYSVLYGLFAWCPWVVFNVCNDYRCNFIPFNMIQVLNYLVIYWPQVGGDCIDIDEHWKKAEKETQYCKNTAGLNPFNMKTFFN